MFDHEKLNAYKKALAFIAWANTISKELPVSIPVTKQFARAYTSMLLNIAEGNGKYTSKDRCNYFDIARGSLLESAACLDILFACDLIDKDKVDKGKNMLEIILKLLVGLIKSNSERRF